MSNMPKQLKKNDFLAIVTETPMTREQIVNALDEYSFIPTYLDYLTDHFVEQGRIIKHEDGTISRTAKKGTTTHEMYRVVHRTEATAEHPAGMSLESRPYVGVMTKEDRDSGWSVTKGAAVKKACSHVFHKYKADTTAIKDLMK